ncbi:MAG: nuclear transport factor 2 family protein [Flavihumibacter sp.]|nr:nuclear transport factor 2 family protein [Flavihumibacter sp.]
MKQILILFTASCFMACNGVVSVKTNTTPAPDSTVVKQAQLLFQKFNQHDWAGMAALYADTALFKDPSLGTGIVPQSRQQTTTKYTELQKTFADIKDSVVAIYPSGNNTVVVEFISKGMAPDGSRFELPIITVLTIENGLITKDFTYYDNSGNK